MFDQHEPERTELSKELTALERQLSALTPLAPRIDRDKLMFAAGQAATSGTKWPRFALSWPKWPGYVAAPSWLRSVAWPAATATMTSAALLMTTMFWAERQALQVAMQQNSPLATTQIAAQPRDLPTRSTARPEMTTTGWTSLRQPGNGYLSVRYTALTRGVGALDPMSQAARSSGGSDIELQPTQREMLNELLPSSHRKANPSS